MSEIYAVISGDLIKSRSATPQDVQTALGLLEKLAINYGKIASFPTKFTRYRGDSWQLIINNPADSLRLSILLFATLRASDHKLDTRIAVGLGTALSTGTDTLADADGPAFHTSGKLLDTIGKRRFAIGGHGIHGLHKAIGSLVEAIMFDWTAAQANAMLSKLENMTGTHDDIAKQLKVTRQTVQAHMSAAHANAIEDAIAAFENDPQLTQSTQPGTETQ